MKTPEDNDALVWVDKDGNSVTESQLAVLEAAACDHDTPALPHHETHHDLVRKGVELIIEEEKSVGGQLADRLARVSAPTKDSRATPTTVKVLCSNLKSF